MKMKKAGWIAGTLAGLALIALGGALILRSDSGSSQSPNASALRHNASETADQKNKSAVGANEMKKATLEESQDKARHTGSALSFETSRVMGGLSGMGIEGASEGAEFNRQNLLALEHAQKEKRSQEALRLQVQQRNKKQEASRQFYQIARIRSRIARMHNELGQYEQDAQPRELQLQQMGRLFGQIDRVRDELAKQQKEILSTDEPTSSQLALAHSLDRDLNQLNQIQSNAKQQLTKHSRTRPRSTPGRENPGVSPPGTDS